MIVIGNKTFTGNNITVSNNRIIIDGKDITDTLPEQKTYNIEVTGDIQSLDVDACNSLTVKGTVGSIKTLSGDVDCGDVTGSVSTMSGDVKCKNISGSVSTMSGKIKHS